MLTLRSLTSTAYRSALLRTITIPRYKMTTASAPGENFEVRQTSATEDWHPDPSKSLPLDKARQALVDDILALYSCEPTIERVKRYTPDCVYDDQFVYANDRYAISILSHEVDEYAEVKLQVQNGWPVVCPSQAIQGF